jgi:hypothetical protein
VGLTYDFFSDLPRGSKNYIDGLHVSIEDRCYSTEADLLESSFDNDTPLFQRVQNSAHPKRVGQVLYANHIQLEQAVELLEKIELVCPHCKSRYHITHQDYRHALEFHLMETSIMNVRDFQTFDESDN